MATRVTVGLLIAAVAVCCEAATIQSRCAAVLAAEGVSQDERSFVQTQCAAREDVWQVVERWEGTHGVQLPGATVGPILRDYFRTEADFAARLHKKPAAVHEAGSAALDEYLTNLLTKPELVPISTILKYKLGSVHMASLGGWDFPRENPYGVIRVLATPSDADVYIDSEFLTSSLHEYAVPAGPHDVLVRKVPFLECAQKVDVRARAHVDVECTLRER